MQIQKHFWLKIIIAGGIVLGVTYFFVQPAQEKMATHIDSSVTAHKSSAAVNDSNKQLINQQLVQMSSSSSPIDEQTITPELQERLSAMQQRRPNQIYSQQDVAAAVNRTSSWTSAEDIPRDLPLQPEEFTDGRQFIELDSLKIETLMPGDQLNVRVDENGKDYKVTIDKVEKHDYNSISWHGHIQGDDGQKYSVSFTRGEQLTVGGLDTPDGHYVIQAHGNKGWVASSQLLFKADTSTSDAIHPADIDPNYKHHQPH